MEDPRWLRLITIGLVLSALAVGYFLLTGRFTSTKTSQVATASPTPNQQIQVAQISPSPAAVSSPRATATPSASSTGNGSNIANLPRTGFPLALIGILSASAIVSGWGLRKYPH